ncbi:MAG: 2,3-bisphosphoglycerate-independent phosphoglycerate mutase [Nitrospirae bacterium]|nr:2,3-bisphosphoglycerate-independent phosphoglycerate mutase [Nitrospirota bacterium]
MSRPKPVMLIVLDGWGINPRRDGNALALARLPFYNSLLEKHPHTAIDGSGTSVGLPDRQMGNSEVGHMNLGAGRILYMDLTRIYRAIETGEFFENSALLSAVLAAKERGTALHLMGLVSDGGVHSHVDHLLALVDLAKKEGLKRVFVHAFLDGRDTPPRSGAGYVEALERALSEKNVGRIATVSGRYFAMDRDKRWDRVKKAHDAMTSGKGEAASSALEAVRLAYDRGETDEFVSPTVTLQAGVPVGTIMDGDAAIFFNFRADRAREITRALTETGFDGFERARSPRLSSFVCMAMYDETFGLPAAYPPERPANILAEVLSDAGMRQFRIAETEKYAHVTFFFNGGKEEPFPGEDRLLIASPREVATYDLKPEMSAPAVTEAVLSRIAEGIDDFILLNFANPDMVGHTGVLEAAVKAAETIDGCLARIVPAARERGGVVLITADHGNIEQMVDYETGQPYTAHTSNLVPFIVVGAECVLREGGFLADVAPTILEIMGLPQPPEMTGRSLIGAAVPVGS